jgi:hypothetical protein
MAEKIRKELRAEVVRASSATPGTKSPLVYQLRNGSKDIAGTFVARLDALDAQGIPIVGVIGVLARSVSHDELDAAA